MRRLISVALAALLVMAGSVAALAHAKMTSTVPSDGATAPIGLSEIRLDFSHPIRLTIVKIVRVMEKLQVATITELPKSFEKSVKLTVDALAAGAYEVSWTAVADDGHVMNGSFTFTVGEPSDAKSKQ